MQQLKTFIYQVLVFTNINILIYQVLRQAVGSVKKCKGVDVVGDSGGLSGGGRRIGVGYRWGGRRVQVPLTKNSNFSNPLYLKNKPITS